MSSDLCLGPHVFLYVFYVFFFFFFFWGGGHFLLLIDLNQFQRCHDLWDNNFIMYTF